MVQKNWNFSHPKVAANWAEKHESLTELSLSL